MRGTAEHLGGTKVRFTCPEGHRFTKDYSKGPIAKRLSANAVVWMCRWWETGVDVGCSRCKREKNLHSSVNQIRKRMIHSKCRRFGKGD
jgi:hypothetical protein